MKKKDVEQLLEKTMQPPYEIDVKPASWVMNNRARFISWIDKTFQPKKRIQREATCDDAQVTHVSLFPHQSFIKDYIQFASPYRGILLYHGIGVGKTFSSIAAAEILLNHMNVVVMLPASLHENYVGEIRKYGAMFYTLRQHWTFIKTKYVTDGMLNILKLSRSWFKKNDGIWLPLPDEAPNFEELDAEEQAMIQAQIDTMIHGAFEFVHYNGLSLDAIAKLSEHGNPFDNKCVIIDEIHNLISMIVNNGKIGRKLYKLLMVAQNMKLIMLSGTPVINYPKEIAYLINLVTGPRILYEVKFVKEGAFDVDAIKELMAADRHVDAYEIDAIHRKILLSFLPMGFVKIAEGEVVRDKDAASTPDALMKKLLEAYRAIGMKPWKIGGKSEFTEHMHLTLPEIEKDFDAYFVNYEKEEVRNPILFMRRILGTVSFYSTYSPELYPEVIITEVPLIMSNRHFEKYEKARDDERKQEKKSATKKGQVVNTLFAKQNQVYKAFSRAVCNFMFPEKIQRPYPTKLKQMQRELDSDELFDETDAEPVNIEAEYRRLLMQAVETLKQGDYLTLSEIGKYSPKYKSIYETMHKVDGPVLVYSQFRTVEGLGLFQCFLEKNGYEELHVQKEGSEWHLKYTDPDTPKFIVFTGNNDETRLLIRIFNKDPTLPVALRDAVNIKAVMITKSGAEGISLKNVRQVHILEPYWNYIRIEQVIGRAVRTCSHIALPKEERNVHVYIYYMKATEAQLKKSRGVKVNDRGLTSDEHIYRIAQRKNNIIRAFLQLMQRASVDCALNAKEHGGDLTCFAFPTNILENKLFFVPNIEQDVQDTQYANETEKVPWNGQVIETEKGVFLMRVDTGELYDWELYDSSKRLVRVGAVKRKPA